MMLSSGYCLIATQTQRSIVWQQLVAERAPATMAPGAAGAAAPASPFPTYPFWSATARPMDASTPGGAGQLKRA